METWSGLQSLLRYEPFQTERESEATSLYSQNGIIERSVLKRESKPLQNNRLWLLRRKLSLSVRSRREGTQMSHWQNPRVSESDSSNVLHWVVSRTMSHSTAESVISWILWGHLLWMKKSSSFWEGCLQLRTRHFKVNVFLETLCFSIVSSTLKSSISLVSVPRRRSIRTAMNS